MVLSQETTSIAKRIKAIPNSNPEVVVSEAATSSSEFADNPNPDMICLASLTCNDLLGQQRAMSTEYVIH